MHFKVLPSQALRDPDPTPLLLVEDPEDTGIVV